MLCQVSWWKCIDVLEQPATCGGNGGCSCSGGGGGGGGV